MKRTTLALVAVVALSALSSSCASVPVPVPIAEEQVPCIVAAGVVAGTCAIPVIAVGGTWLALPDGEVPGYGMRQEGGPYSGADVAEAADLFLRVWQARRGRADEVRTVLDRLDLRWERTPHFEEYGRHSAGFTDRAGSDGFFHRGRLRLAWMPDVPLWRTALVHEWAHVALWVTEGDPDHNHTPPPGPWTAEVYRLIDDVNAALAEHREHR